MWGGQEEGGEEGREALLRLSTQARRTVTYVSWFEQRTQTERWCGDERREVEGAEAPLAFLSPLRCLARIHELRTLLTYFVLWLCLCLLRASPARSSPVVAHTLLRFRLGMPLDNGQFDQVRLSRHSV